VKLATAQGTDLGTRWNEKDLVVRDGEAILLEKRSGKTEYLAVVASRPGSPAELALRDRGKDAALKVPKNGLESLTIYRVHPVAVWRRDSWRPCQGDCPVPPKPPIPIVESVPTSRGTRTGAPR
jgi:hypothetical protein